MKTLTIWQPWASLLACGAKQYETRSWATNYRGEIAIHAALKDFDTLGLEYDTEFWEAAATALSNPELIGLPKGCIIATAELVECWKITHSGHTMGSNRAARIEGGKFEGKTNIIDGKEILFGDWTPGRYAWEFANVQLLSEPVPTKGRQGLWEWNR